MKKLQKPLDNHPNTGYNPPMSKTHFNDEFDWTNDDGYSTLDDLNIPQEWLDEEEAYWSEDTLDPGDEDNYDPVDDGENSEAADEWDGEEWDDDETPIGLEYDGYNDADNY